MVADSYRVTKEEINDYFDSHQRAYGKSEFMDNLRAAALRGCDGPDGDSPPIHLIRDEALETGFWHGVHVAQRIARESSKEAYDNIESHLYGPDIEALKRSVCDATGGES